MDNKYEPCAICEEYIEGIICDKDQCPIAIMKTELEQLKNGFGSCTVQFG